MKFEKFLNTIRVDLEKVCRQEIYKFVTRNIWVPWLQINRYDTIIQSIHIDFTSCIFYIQVFSNYIFDWEHFYKDLVQKIFPFENKIYSSNHSLQIDIQSWIPHLHNDYNHMMKPLTQEEIMAGITLKGEVPLINLYPFPDDELSGFKTLHDFPTRLDPLPYDGVEGITILHNLPTRLDSLPYDGVEGITVLHNLPTRLFDFLEECDNSFPIK